MNRENDIKEKENVAILSVIAAAALVLLKTIVGIATGSLGIISEALHSALDLIAAAITWLAVKFSDRPADNDHNFGHGKMENFSALVEAFLLLLVCVWIIYEAIDRLANERTEIEVGFWSFAVVITSICVDIGRARALSKAAKKFKSQALEADALHFKTDIWSSVAVLIGVIGAYLKCYSADAIAALFVAVISITISFKLSYRAVNELLDKAPEGMNEKISSIIKGVDGVIKSHDLRVRTSGGIYIVDVNIHVCPTLSIVQAHEIAERVECVLRENVGQSIINVHIEPD